MSNNVKVENSPDVLELRAKQAIEAIARDRASSPP